MAQTIDEQKERYYNLVLEKANKMYSSWRAQKVTSKQLVAKAYEYAFDKRLRTNASYRFYTLVFTVALEIRLGKRYATFLRRLFLLFAYLRERSALNMLKRVLGFRDSADMREIIEMEAEKAIEMLKSQQDQESTGGGKRSEMGEQSVEEQLDKFLEECAKEDEPPTAENDLDAEMGEQVEGNGEPQPEKAENAEREQISVEELETGNRLEEKDKEKNSAKEKGKTVKESSESVEAEASEAEQTEKTEQKSVANNSGIDEVIGMAGEASEELPSPFPIFRENSEGKAPAYEGKESVSASDGEPNPEKGSDGSVDKEARVEGGEEKTPFPVFGNEKSDGTKAPEKVETKESVKQETVKQESVKQEPIKQEYVADSKSSQEVTANAGKTEVVLGASALDNPNLSDENRARIELNVELSKMEILAMTEQLKAAANLEMQQSEQEWREQISVADSSGQSQLRTQEVAPTSNQGAVTVGLKK